MADIFISYKREDRRFAERLSIALEQLGFEVWWDLDLLAGDKYRAVIREVIDKSKAAIVVWSHRSIESDFVIDEATYAKNRNKLCPLRIDDVEIPFGFGQTHTNDLADWEGEHGHEGFQAVVRAVEARVGRKGRLGAPRTEEAHSELEAFKTAQLAGSAGALQSFLRAYPESALATFVRGQVSDLAVKATNVASAVTSSATQTASAFMDTARERMRPPAPPPPVEPEPPPKKQPPWPLVGAIAAIAGLALAGFLVLNNMRTEQVAREAGAGSCGA
jgi:hypothetical protein